MIIAGQAAEAKKWFKGATAGIKHLELADSFAIREPTFDLRRPLGASRPAMGQ